MCIHVLVMEWRKEVCCRGLTLRDILLSVRTDFEDKEGRYGGRTLETGATGVQLQLCRKNQRPEIMFITEK